MVAQRCAYTCPRCKRRREQRRASLRFSRISSCTTVVHALRARIYFFLRISAVGLQKDVTQSSEPSELRALRLFVEKRSIHQQPLLESSGSFSSSLSRFFTVSYRENLEDAQLPSRARARVQDQYPKKKKKSKSGKSKACLG